MGHSWKMKAGEQGREAWNSLECLGIGEGLGVARALGLRGFCAERGPGGSGRSWWIL